jgi:restriction system protein
MSRSRKKESGLEGLFHIFTMTPTWVGPVVAVLSYLVVRYMIPSILERSEQGESTSAMTTTLGTFARSFAPSVSALILLVWVAAEIKKWFDRRRLDSTNDLEDIRNLSWRDFERLVGEAYRRKGYRVEETGSPAGDGGVDLILHANGDRTLVQCKHWKQRKVGVKVVRELYGAMHDQGAAYGIVVCFDDYTQEARSFAERNSMELVPGRELERLIAEVRSSSTRSPSHQIQAPASVPGPPAVISPSESPLCPKCSGQMTLRKWPHNALNGCCAPSAVLKASHTPRRHLVLLDMAKVLR